MRPNLTTITGPEAAAYEAYAAWLAANPARVVIRATMETDGDRAVVKVEWAE